MDYEITFDNIVGKTIVVKMTVKNTREEIIGYVQYFGIIQLADPKKGIHVEDPEGKIHNIPPYLPNIFIAEPGEYKNTVTGKYIENPDFISKWFVTQPDA